MTAPPAPNPATLAGSAGTDTGDQPAVIVDFFRGTTATGPPALSATTTATAGAYTVTVPALADGTWTARARQSDAAGNSGTSPARTFTIDHTAATPTLTLPATFNATTPSLTGNAGTAAGDDPFVSIRVYPGTTTTGNPLNLPGRLGADGSFSVGAALSDGTYTAEAVQGDLDGNQGISAPETFVVDTAAPKPTLSTVDAFNPTAVHGTAEDGEVVLDLSRAGAPLPPITVAARAAPSRRR